MRFVDDHLVWHFLLGILWPDPVYLIGLQCFLNRNCMLMLPYFANFHKIRCSLYCMHCRGKLAQVHSLTLNVRVLEGNLVTVETANCDLDRHHLRFWLRIPQIPSMPHRCLLLNLKLKRIGNGLQDCNSIIIQSLRKKPITASRITCIFQKSTALFISYVVNFWR